MSYLDRIVDQRVQTEMRYREILNTAYGENRDLTPEEIANLETADADIDRFNADEQRILSLEAKLHATDALRASIGPVIEQARRGPVQTDRDRLAAMFRGELDSFESRALQSAGGSAIDQTFYDRVTVYERTLVPVLEVATVLNTPRGEPIVLPRLTADPAHGGTVTAEAAAINELDPTISSVQLDSYKYGIVTLWSRELDNDNVIDLEDLVARASARELAIDIGAHLTTGDGSGKPNGFINAGTNGGTASGTSGAQASDTFFSAYDLITLYYTLAVPYRMNGSWQVSNTAAAKMRKARDSTGQLLWELSTQAGQPTNFLGRPVYENPAMAAVASASKSVAFGDFSRYFVRRLPLRVERSTEYKFSTDQLAIKVVERIDGDLVDTAAVAYLVSANT